MPSPSASTLICRGRFRGWSLLACFACPPAPIAVPVFGTAGPALSPFPSDGRSCCVSSWRMASCTCRHSFLFPSNIDACLPDSALSPISSISSSSTGRSGGRRMIAALIADQASSGLANASRKATGRAHVPPRPAPRAQPPYAPSGRLALSRCRRRIPGALLRS